MKCLYLSALVSIGVLSASPQPIETLDLAGEWKFALDAEDYGIKETPDRWQFPDVIQLPGMVTAQGFGDEPSFETNWTGETWRYPDMFVEWQAPDNFKFPFFLQPPLHFLGPAWYQRDIEVPDDWKGHPVDLFLERVHWQSTVWFDGRKVGEANALGTPHRLRLGKLAPGAHRLTLRIDNRLDKINVGPSAHSVSDQTQGNWNGVVGTMELQALAASHIEGVDLFPSADGTVRIKVDGQLSDLVGEATLRIEIHPIGDSSNTTFLKSEVVKQAEDGSFSAERVAKVGDPKLWNEFSPTLYQATVFLQTGDDMAEDTHRTTFGFREIENRDGRLILNGEPAFLRGTLECAIFPLLGHPPTEVDPWKRIIRICKAHGLNHIRFHSWCPPKAAFIAADELGFYYQVEASAWANGTAAVGSGRPVDAWINAETERIREEYGNHPSFLLMAYGNEPGGPNHAKWLADWVKRQQQADSRRLYTTGAGWPVVKGSDFHNPFQPRVQRWGEGLGSIINAKPPQTDFDWSDYLGKHTDAPVISHEIGQWCAYPNFKEIDKYTGYFKARNFEIFREVARRNGVLKQSEDFLVASGKWQALCYKHDIEAALRTEGFGGFQLLDLHDFPGQGTALVGVLDAFWDEKGYISPEEYRAFSGPIVPLARLKKMVYTVNETLEAALQLSHFGQEDLSEATPVWTIRHGEKTVAGGKLPARQLSRSALHDLATIRVPLNQIEAPAKLTLSVSIEGTDARNSWDLFVYPNVISEAPEKNSASVITKDLKTAQEALAAGRNVLWLVPPGQVADDFEHPIKTGFSTVFWNTAYTNWQPPHTLGLRIDPEHPALSRFPTDIHTNWQWWEIVTGSQPFLLTKHQDLIPLVQPIDDWFTNRKLGLVFEAKVGKGKLIACSADLDSGLDNRPAARQLRHSLEAYLGSTEFDPEVTLTAADLAELVVQPSMLSRMNATAEASSEAKGYETMKAIDGDRSTFWHSRFEPNPALPPHTLTLTLPEAIGIEAILVTHRQDGNKNGHLKTIELLDEHGEVLVTTKVREGAGKFRISLPSPIKTRSLTLRMPTVANGKNAAIAEIDIVPASKNP